MSKKTLVVFLLFLLPLLSFSQAKDTIVDSHYSWTELQKEFIAFYSDPVKSVMSAEQKKAAIHWVNEKLSLVDVIYTGFDNHIHKGQILCHRAVTENVKKIFDELLLMHFPVYQCKPVSGFGFDDIQSMEANNTNSFDFRFKTNVRTLSKHAYGLAIDINPVVNPYKKGREILPGNNNESSTIGRIRSTEEQGRKVIAIFRKYGWTWGGNWRSLHDYMHFEMR